MKFLNFIQLLLVIFAFLIRIHWLNWIRIQLGSGSATLLLTNGSGSRRPKNMWICYGYLSVLRIRDVYPGALIRITGKWPPGSDLDLNYGSGFNRVSGSGSRRPKNMWIWYGYLSVLRIRDVYPGALIRITGIWPPGSDLDLNYGSGSTSNSGSGSASNSRSRSFLFKSRF